MPFRIALSLPLVVSTSVSAYQQNDGCVYEVSRAAAG